MCLCTERVRLCVAVYGTITIACLSINMIKASFIQHLADPVVFTAALGVTSAFGVASSNHIVIKAVL